MTTTARPGELTGHYVLDTSRTRIGFVARAALVSRVRGWFDGFDGTAELDGATPSRSAVRLTVRADSVRTGNRRRDEHLRGKDFLDTQAHPVIAFGSTRIEQVAEDAFAVTGALTVRGVTRPVTVRCDLTGAGPDPRGVFRIALTGTATLDRTDWGVTRGGVLIGDKVALRFDVSAFRRP
ncbi:YceI family protein [Streptomyces fumanus]|uniref:Polyisoprenoid-binding protein n=1 Tax=Streptomyces fumanus TaxID=67302 RepID=A0A919A913_9ACTN|nr:YceI family protein [Streptomyces fumanus]GHE93558.1 polyisoprenoid-binding protein [Streptomyces fumanus]